MAVAEIVDVREARTEASLSVGGMTCGACAARIERQLNALDGVEASVNFATERAKVVLETTTSVDRVIEEIRSAGFTAEPLASPADLVDTSEIDRRVHSLGRRLLVAALFSMPLCDASLAFSLVPSIRFPYWQWLLIALAAPVVTWAAWPFYRAAIKSARHGTSTMDTLVSIGILSATGWSLYAMFWRDTNHAAQSLWFVIVHQAGGAIYIDVAAGVTTFLLAGRYFEATSRRKTGNALRSLAAVGAKTVAVLDARGDEHRRSVDELQVGDRFVVRPGEKVATDGEVIEGNSAIDRSAMTGESLPVDVSVGDKVVGGTISVGGRLVVLATSVGRDTQLGAHAAAGRGRSEREGVRAEACGPDLERFRAHRARNSSRDFERLAALWWLDRARVQCRHLGSHHRLPLCTRTCDADCAARRFWSGRPARDLLQGLPGARGVSRGGHGRARQDRDRHDGEDDCDGRGRGVRHGPGATCCAWPAHSNRHPNTSSQGPSRRSLATS